MSHTLTHTHLHTQVTTEEPVVVSVPDYVKNLGKLLKNTPKRYIPCGVNIEAVWY